MSRRKQLAYEKRQAANLVAHERNHPDHIANGEEQKFRHHEDLKYKPSYLMSFTKGIPHNYDTGLIENPDDFQYFVKAIDSGNYRDFRDTPLGHPQNRLGHQCGNDELKWKSKKAKKGKDGEPVPVRAWESQSAGNSFDLEGPDAQAVTMPPAPILGSPELSAEMAEVYCQALLRDIPFNAYSVGVMGLGSQKTKQVISANPELKALSATKEDVKKVKHHTDRLNKLEWFQETTQLKLSPEEEERRRCLKQFPSNAFRGITPGDDVGPYLSQFLLAGNAGINGNDGERSPSDGLISYGAISIDQKVRTAKPKLDYMTTWEEWFDVQRGADLRGLEKYTSNPGRRFIFTPRDLATYVHYDALYEAYLNACLILLGNGIPFDPGIPFQEADNRDHQQGFAHFGGPHILSLVTEVATRALKAVRFQKYNVHRRCRPEVLAARIHKFDKLQHMAPELKEIKDDLKQILPMVAQHNGKPKNFLLPMAFCEGSPMHPAYGAGHATVAGACITILKAFFDHKHHLSIVPTTEASPAIQKLVKNLPHADGKKLVSANLAYVSKNNGNNLGVIPVLDKDCKLTKLTVEGELNKLASNISIGRNWAGVHYFTDYYESLLMGEQIALGILQEQKLTYSENFSMTVPLFNGTSRRI